VTDLTSTSRDASEPMIRLEELTKRYPGQREAAVDSVSMDIPEGEIVVLVGPSGCGKTTTMKMINRIIEPTSGNIFLEGENVTNINPDKLRRRIGYVIQQIGLFPHRTIADNIATVPRLLEWDKDRIRKRVDELIEVVGMEPDDFRNRYPKELSGGQRQRIGVARAMAADPPVMLMDEPFGAIDPITRERLQNEFLRVQEDIKKTIIFVTHDIDEAIKMGDRICILRQSARIAQFDTPETILTAPADDFVADFIGSGASLKRLNLSRVRDIELVDYTHGTPDEEKETLRRRLNESDDNFVLPLDEQRRPTRWLTDRDLGRDSRSLLDSGAPVQAIVEPQATLSDALNEMLISHAGVSVVVDGKGAYQGVVTIETITEAIKSMRSASAAAERAKREGQPEHVGS
jgi:osmoprotectant transport system ATP-binding protein